MEHFHPRSASILLSLRGRPQLGVILVLEERRDTYRCGLCFSYPFCCCAQDLCAYDITFPRCLRVSIFLVCPHSSGIQVVIEKSVPLFICN